MNNPDLLISSNRNVKASECSGVTDVGLQRFWDPAGRVHQSDRFPPEDELSPAAASQTGSLIKQTFPLHTTNNEPRVLHRHPARYTSSLWPISLSQHRLNFLCWLNIYGALQRTTICTSTPQQLSHRGGFWVFPPTFYKSPELSKTRRKHFIIISA